MLENGLRKNIKVADKSLTPQQSNANLCNCSTIHKVFTDSLLTDDTNSETCCFALYNDCNEEVGNDSRSNMLHYSLEHEQFFDSRNIPISNNECYSLIPVWCDFCHSFGHLSRDCPEVLPPDGARRRVCANCCSRDHVDHNKCPKKLCTICYETGHSTNMCGKHHHVSSTCYRCNMKGHERALCPSLWRQYFLIVDNESKSGSDVAMNDHVNARKFCCICAEEGHFYAECYMNQNNSENTSNYSFSNRNHDKKPNSRSNSTFNNNSSTSVVNNGIGNSSSNRRTNFHQSANNNRHRGNRANVNSRGASDSRKLKFTPTSTAQAVPGGVSNKPGLLDSNNNSQPVDISNLQKMSTLGTTAQSSAANVLFHQLGLNNTVNTTNPLQMIFDAMSKTQGNPICAPNLSLTGQMDTIGNNNLSNNANTSMRFFYPGCLPALSQWAPPLSFTGVFPSIASPTFKNDSSIVPQQGSLSSSFRESISNSFAQSGLAAQSFNDITSVSAANAYNSFRQSPSLSVESENTDCNKMNINGNSASGNDSGGALMMSRSLTDQRNRSTSLSPSINSQTSIPTTSAAYHSQSAESSSSSAIDLLSLFNK